LFTNAAGTRFRRAPAAIDRVRTSGRRHPAVVDGVLVLLLFVVGHPHRGEEPHTPVSGVAWLLVCALLLPLIWRRRAPALVFVLVAVAAFLQWLHHDLLAADLAPLVAFYTVAAYEPLRRVLIAATVLEVGAVLAAVRFAPPQATVWGFVFISGLIAAAGFIGYNIRTRRAYLAALEDRAARLERDRDREAHLAAVAERTRIAREMHDVVAHNIAVMIALADGAAYTAGADPDRATEIMGQVSDTGRSALAEMRRLLGVMREHRPDGEVHAPQPTIDDIDALLTAVRAAGLPTRLRVSGPVVPLPPSAQLAIYRMVQESLTNTLKHAAAAAAEVSLVYRDGEVELTVVDNGAAASANGDGHGIAGMRERAAVFGGDVQAGPVAGGGWRVRCVLHLQPVPAEAAVA
jgi:signal transduction histidine kinase